MEGPVLVLLLLSSDLHNNPLMLLLIVWVAFFIILYNLGELDADLLHLAVGEDRTHHHLIDVAPDHQAQPLANNEFKSVKNRLDYRLLKL